MNHKGTIRVTQNPILLRDRNMEFIFVGSGSYTCRTRSYVSYSSVKRQRVDSPRCPVVSSWFLRENRKAVAYEVLPIGLRNDALMMGGRDSKDWTPAQRGTLRLEALRSTSESPGYSRAITSRLVRAKVRPPSLPRFFQAPLLTFVDFYLLCILWSFGV